MRDSLHGSRWFDRAWIAFWGVVSSIWCLTAAGQLGATFDEPFYLRSGLESWRTGSNRSMMRAGTMPLPINVETLPLYIWEECRGRPLDTEKESDRMLPIARAGNLFFWWILLYFSWRLGRRFGGPWAGRLAVVMIACEPNFLAHASLATTDISICACLAMFVEVYLAGRQGNWARRVGLPGFCYGIMLLAKASALAFGPLVMLSFELHRLWNRPRLSQPAVRVSKLRSLWRVTRPFLRDFWHIIFLGLAVAFIWCGSDWREEKSFVEWARKLPPGFGHDAMLFIAENLRVFPNAGRALVYQIQHNMRGHGVFILGDWFPRAVWYYFPVALIIKLSIPVLALLAGLLVARPRSFVSPLGLLIVLMLLFTLNCRVQIGIRLILPFVTLLMIAISVALAKTLAQLRVPVWFPEACLGSLCVLLLLPMVAIWPDGLCYTNQLWGGPQAGCRYLNDSNYDWGQGLKELAGWRKRHGEPAMKIWYYGTDPAIRALPENTPLHSFPLKSEEDVLRLLRGTYLAVGATIVHGNPEPTPSATQVLAVLKHKKPIARTMTFFIYDFIEPKAVVSSP